MSLYEVGDSPGLGPTSLTVGVIGHEGQKLRYGLHASRSLAEQIEAIHEDIGDQTRPPKDFALFAQYNNTYFTAESWLEGIP
eukprot:5310648-Prymnesium_polylepis.1